MALWVYDDHRDSPYKTHLDYADEILLLLRRNKVKTNIVYNDISNMLDDEEAILFIPYELFESHKDIIKQCNRAGIPVFALSGSVQLDGCYYSSICSDLISTVLSVYSYLKQCNKNKTAYFGIRTNPVDVSKASVYFQLNEQFTENDIFYMINSFEECFEKFFKRRHEYDSIIFSNDIVAVCFIEKMKEMDKEYCENVFIISYMNTVLSQVYHTPITSSSYDRKSIPNAALNLYRSLVKSRDYAETHTITLKSIVFPRKTTNFIPFCEEKKYDDFDVTKMSVRKLPKTDKESSPLFDPIIHTLLNIEEQLRNSDAIDIRLICMFLQGKDNDEISRNLFVSYHTVSYRSKNMFKKMGVRNKREFLNLVSKYVNADNLEKYIMEEIV